MYPGIKSKDYTDLRDVIATYLLRELPTVEFTNAVLDSDHELVEEIQQFGSYDTMTREYIFNACSEFLLKVPHLCNSDASKKEIEKFDKDLKKAYADWIINF